MGIDKSLWDAYPSVIINGSKYHYGKTPESDGYIVENAYIAKDYWYFTEKQDLEAFLINLPESADRNLRLKLHPDWREVTPEQRSAYMEGDKLLFRAWAAEKIANGTAQSYNLDLEGEHGPHNPQRIQESGGNSEVPSARVERQLAEYKASHAPPRRDPDLPDGNVGDMIHRLMDQSFGSGLSEAGKLRILEGEIDWNGVSDQDKKTVLSREVDFSKITPEQFQFVYADIEFEKFEPADAQVATQLFVGALNAEQQADYQAARMRDYGPDDAGTPRAELTAISRDTADPPEFERQSYIPAVLSNADAKELAAELDQIKSATYVECEEQVAGWNYEKGDGGLAFNELPVVDREVMIEDYVDWGKYMERGLTWVDQGRIMYYAARDVVPEEANPGRSGTELRHDGFAHQVPEESQDRDVRPLTHELIACCHLDVWPGMATVVDFGIDSDRHLGALQFAVRQQLVTEQELDAAMADGPKLTEIAKRGDNPYRDVTFKTSWDDLRIEPDDPPEGESNSSGDAFGRVGDEKALHVETRTDCEPARLRDNGQDFEKILKEAKDRAMSRMQGKDTDPERDR